MMLRALFAAERSANDRRDSLRKELGTRLRAERNARKLAPKAVAEAIGTKTGVIVGIENGEKWPRDIVEGLIGFYAPRQAVTP